MAVRNSGGIVFAQVGDLRRIRGKAVTDLMVRPSGAADLSTHIAAAMAALQVLAGGGRNALRRVMEAPPSSSPPRKNNVLRPSLRAFTLCVSA
jgi:hypothetical protein